MSENSAPGADIKKSFSSELIGTVFLLLGVLVFLSLLSYEQRIVPADGEPTAISNIVGTAGHYTAHILLFLFGHAAHFLGPYLAVMGFLYIYRGEVQELILRLFAALVILIATSVLIKLFSNPGTEFWSAGGVIGRRLGHALEFLFGKYGAIILTAGIFVAGGFLGTRLPFVALVDNLKEFLRKQSSYAAFKKPTPTGEAPAPAQPPHQAQAPEPPAAEAPAPQAPMAAGVPPLFQTASGNEQSYGMEQAAPGEGRRETETGAWDDMNSRPFIEKRRTGGLPWIEYDEDAVMEDANPVANEEGDEPAAVFHAGEALRVSRRALDVATKLRDFQSRFPEEAPAAKAGSRADSSGAPASSIKSPSAPTRMAPTPRPIESGRPAAMTAGGGTNPDGQRDFTGHFNYDESRFHFRHAFSGGSAAREREIGRTAAVSRETVGPGRKTEAFSDERPLLRPLNTAILEEPPVREELVLPEALPVREHFTNHREAPTAPRTPQEAHEQPVGYHDFQNDFPGDAVSESPIDTPVHSPLNAPEDLQSATRDEFAADDIRGMETIAPSAEVEQEIMAEVKTPPEAPVAENVASENVAPENMAQQPATEGTAPDGMVEHTAYEAEPVITGVPPMDLKGRKYRLPLEILNLAPMIGHENVAREIELTCARLEVVMRDYGIQAKVVRTQRGPIVTLYEVKLEPGVKVSRILGINDEIKMNLEAPSIRIMAPIPGKSTVGIEIPNKTRETVTLGDLARKDRDFFAESRNLSIVLGKDIAGHNNYVDLTKLPHLLIAGATGAGKSVYMNSIIASLLYTQSPEDVRFIMIDPKMVELTLYEGIPHLLMPVITDVRKASRALAWAVVEMERRYAAFSRLRCRDIRSYNDRVKNRIAEGDDEAKTMPYIVILLDELSDLMMVAAKDVEDSIIRLTQKARAVGIHVVMATQRPSVDVITALIKANCPARIAFQVAQRTDSRTILDSNGAESLLGSGDLLYKSPTSAGLTRIQSPLITEGEIESIVAETRKFGVPNYIEMPGDSEEGEFTTEESDVDQELFGQAWKIVLETGKTSTSYVQRRLRIGYNRAARIIEMMEERGYLGPAVGNKPREILKKT